MCSKTEKKLSKKRKPVEARDGDLGINLRTTINSRPIENDCDEMKPAANIEDAIRSEESKSKMGTNETQELEEGYQKMTFEEPATKLRKTDDNESSRMPIARRKHREWNDDKKKSATKICRLADLVRDPQWL